METNTVVKIQRINSSELPAYQIVYWFSRDSEQYREFGQRFGDGPIGTLPELREEARRDPEVALIRHMPTGKVIDNYCLIDTGYEIVDLRIGV